MALDALLQSLTRDADHEAAALLEQANAEAVRIGADADAQVARRCSEAVEAFRRDLRERGEAARARARRDAHLRTLEAQQRLLARIHAAVVLRLADAMRDEREPVLAALVREGLAYLPSVPAVVRCPPALVGRVRAAVDGTAADVRVLGDDGVRTGVRVEAADGSVVVDNTLDGRLRRIWPSLSIDLIASVGALA